MTFLCPLKCVCTMRKSVNLLHSSGSSSGRLDISVCCLPFWRVLKYCCLCSLTRMSALYHMVKNMRWICRTSSSHGRSLTLPQPRPLPSWQALPQESNLSNMLHSTWHTKLLGAWSHTQISQHPLWTTTIASQQKQKAIKKGHAGKEKKKKTKREAK